jgi:hypothetical protein
MTLQTASPKRSKKAEKPHLGGFTFLVEKRFHPFTALLVLSFLVKNSFSSLQLFSQSRFTS